MPLPVAGENVTMNKRVFFENQRETLREYLGRVSWKHNDLLYASIGTHHGRQLS
jgi:hypothetical protein